MERKQIISRLKKFKVLVFYFLLLFSLTITIKCTSESDEKLLDELNHGLQNGNFHEYPQSLRALSMLIQRGNSEVYSSKVVDCLVATGASLIDDNANWTDRNEAQILYDIIKQYDQKTNFVPFRSILGNEVNPPKEKLIIEGLVRKVLKDDENRLHVLFLGVKLGLPRNEDRLTEVLYQYGDKKMAEDFLNSGSLALQDSAKQWANKHGYSISTGKGSHRVSWSKF